MIFRTTIVLMLISVAPMAAAEIVGAKGAQLRMLDKLTGVVSDYDMAVGASQAEGRLTVTLDDCRYPSDVPSEAYAHLTIMDNEVTGPVFKAWMIASSPALSALDHPRYDVWVLRCDVPAATATDSTSGG